MKLETERDWSEWVWATKALAVVSAWSGLGLFERLRSVPMLRSELGADPRAIETTLPVLSHVGLLVADDDRVGLTPAAERLLKAGAMPSAHNLEWLRDLSRLGDLLRQGGPVRDDAGNSKGT